MHDCVNSCSNRAMFKLHCARTENTTCSLLFGHTCDLETMSWLSQLEGFCQTKQSPPLNTCTRWKGENGFIHDLVDVINKSYSFHLNGQTSKSAVCLLSNKKGPPNPNLNSVPPYLSAATGDTTATAQSSAFSGEINWLLEMKYITIQSITLNKKMCLMEVVEYCVLRISELQRE